MTHAWIEMIQDAGARRRRSAAMAKVSGCRPIPTVACFMLILLTGWPIPSVSIER